ncbi:tRNA pseudouridine synthase [Lichtheimia hyalospora FSU 10163]|nr:tRNA pseudouridine synthase [Lichtheimia hyalospora FSU 10163]
MPAEEPETARAGEKRKSTASASASKRNKTTKQRRDHFRKNQSWDSKGDDRPERDGPKEPRIPKKKVALLIGFNGTGYQGMQMNPNAKSIEDDVFKALCKAGAISKDNSDDPKKVQWMRAARTDKGVHAAGNVLSLKMSMPGDDIIRDINSHLPDQIRVWGYVPTKRSFHAKTQCDSRVYEYLLPTYAFMPPAPRELKLRAKDGYRINEQQLAQFREALSKFAGTHNFHNYTIGRGAKDRSCNRYIMDIKVDDPIYINGAEWLSVKLHGQSFMLHQIRKMISMALLIVRSESAMSLIDKSFEETRINIPKAPAVGLLLERPVYSAYNKHTERDPIDFDAHKDTIEEFKQTWIYKKIFEEERENGIFDVFLSSVDSNPGPEFSYLNAEGVIPEDAIVNTKHNAPKKDQVVEEDED